MAAADIVLLIIGPRYSRPTEDEFEEARRLGKPILVLRQEGPLDDEQAAFLTRVGGGWKDGRLWGVFTPPDEAGFAAVQALTNMSASGRRDELRSVAQTRAAALAVGARSQPTGGRGSLARVALVPLVAIPLLDVVALEEPDLGDAVADLARSARLVAHSIGITSQVSREGVRLDRAGLHVMTQPMVAVSTEGAIACEIEVGGGDGLGGMRIDPDRLSSGINAVADFAVSIWARIDTRAEIQEAAVALAILDAQHKLFGLPRTPGRGR